MADVNVQKGQKQPASRQQESGEESRAMTGQGQRGMAQRGIAPSIFSISPRELFSASPFELMRRFSEDMDRFFEGGPWRGAGMPEARMWSPPVEVTEQDGNFKVCAELPGLRKEDVKVELTSDGLIITGERKREQEERGEGVYRSERFYGTFYRLIPIPEEADMEQAKAQFENGLLTVTVPIPESKRRRREIPIEGGAQQGGTSRAA